MTMSLQISSATAKPKGITVQSLRQVEQNPNRNATIILRSVLQPATFECHQHCQTLYYNSMGPAWPGTVLYNIILRYRESDTSCWELKQPDKDSSFYQAQCLLAVQPMAARDKNISTSSRRIGRSCLQILPPC